MLQLFGQGHRRAIVGEHGVALVLVVVGGGALELEVGELVLVLFDELVVHFDYGVHWLLVGEGLVEVADVLGRVHLRNVLRS